MAFSGRKFQILCLLSLAGSLVSSQSFAQNDSVAEPAPAAIPAQPESAAIDNANAPRDAMPPSLEYSVLPSRYYEARITPRGYSIYVPFYLPRGLSGKRSEKPRDQGKRDEFARSVAASGDAPDHGYEVRTREEIVAGEVVQIYRPAVYEIDADGQERLIAPETWVTLPKIRIILEAPRNREPAGELPAGDGAKEAAAPAKAGP